MTDSQAPEALLPCPFCGGEGEMSYYALAKNPAPAGHFIECTTCAASGEYAKIQGEMPDRVEFAQARAIAAWNRRAPSPIPPAPSMVGLREKVARIISPDAFRTRDRHYAEIARLVEDGHQTEERAADLRLSADAYPARAFSKADAILALLAREGV
jgi:Lar family restriction alleviation protein